MTVKTLTFSLNPAQQLAVRHGKGPALVVAGAGSGKTRVITARILRLLQEEGVAPFRLLAVTFTNKAAGEMRERVRKGAGKIKLGDLFLGTFHSFCARMLRANAARLALAPDFSIYDDFDQMTLLKECYFDLRLDEKQIPPRAVHAAVSQAKNELLSPEDYAGGASGFFQEHVARLYALYQKKLLQNAAVDFDDLLFSAVRLLQEHPDLAAAYRERFEYVLVDEYQDINTAQYRLLKLLVAPRNNLMVVGDPDQSIYGWRGADLRNILRFEKDFPGAKVYSLEENYRSFRPILEAAQAVIENNTHRREKKLRATREGGEAPLYYQAPDEKEEAEFIARRIQEKHMVFSRAFKDFAVLYRTNAQSRVLEEALRRHRIPYQIIGGIQFYERKEIKDILAYLRVLVNPKDSVSLKRILNVPPRGLGSGTLEKLETSAKQNGLSLLEAVERHLHAEDLGARAHKALRAFVDLVEELRRAAEESLPSQAARLVLEKSGYLHMLEEEGNWEAQNRLENVRELVSSIADYEAREPKAGLGGFLEQVSLSAEVDRLKEDQDAVRLMTLHNAKGLEFPVVFLAGMEEELFPHAHSTGTAWEIEEERRLCYVGMTRAMEELFLTSAAKRSVYGESRWKTPSRFLAEIPPENLRVEGHPLVNIGSFAAASKGEAEEFSKELHDRRTNDDFPVDPLWDDDGAFPVFDVGDRVEHERFGKGRVVRTTGSGESLKITVHFRGVGAKKFPAKAPQLKKIASR